MADKNDNGFINSINAHNQQQVAREKVYAAGLQLSEALEELNGGVPIPFNLVIWGDETMHITNIQKAARTDVEGSLLQLMKVWGETFPDNDGQ